MIKRSTIKKAVGTVCFLLVFLLVFFTAAGFFERKASAERYQPFWDNPDDYDVLFIGNSHVYRSVQPMELWHDFGIRSYDLAMPASFMGQMYWMLENALLYSNPKVVVIDSYHIEAEEKVGNKTQLIHTGFDSIPFSATKVKAAMDLFETTDEQLEYLFNFSVYHNRWKELEKKDFAPNYSKSKGALIETKIRDMSDYQLIDKSDMMQEDTLGFAYMRKMIEICQERGIQVVLTSIPCCNGEEFQRAMNGLERLSQEYGVPFLNMSYDPSISIDYGTDFMDIGHLNLAGAQKVTDYMGSYLTDTFGFSRENQSEKDVEAWDHDYDVFASYQIKQLAGEKKLYGYLLRSNDKDLDCEIFRKQEAAEDSLSDRLIGKISNKKLITAEEVIAQLGTLADADYIFIVKDANTGEILDTAVFAEGKRQ